MKTLGKLEALKVGGGTEPVVKEVQIHGQGISPACISEIRDKLVVGLWSWMSSSCEAEIKENKDKLQFSIVVRT